MDGNIGVADILITAELSRRPARAADSAAQAQAFHAVALTLDGDAAVCFAALAEAARGLCLADSAGVCVLDETAVGAARMRWVGRAGERAHDGPGDLGREMMGSASLFGYCLEQGGPQLFALPERFFAGTSEPEPGVAEALTVPFRAGALRGAIWVSCRDERHRFTAGDAEVLGSLGAMAGAVLAREQAQTEARAMGAGLEQWRLALIANRQFAEHVVESSGDCILELDQEGMALSINSPGLRLMEIEDFDAWRQRAWASWWAEPAATAARAAVAAARAGEAQSFEGPCLTARGRPKWWHVLVTAVAGTHGGPERLLVVCRDATEGREAGEAVQRALATADAANRQKNLFLAALSHELRTPLSPVVLAVAAMQTDARLPEEVRHDLELIRRNVDLEVRLIDDLLDVSRAVSGKLRLTRERAGVHNLLRLALDICASDAHLKKITVRRLWGAWVDEINADSARVQQIFWNLLKNSIKFSPEGSVIEVETVNPTPGIIEIRVSDQGQGIEAAMLPRLFEAFEQGSNATTQRFGGLGLGLAICKALTQLHSGTITAASAGAGLGASFTVRLPLAPALPAAAAAAAPIAGVEAVTAKLRILVVEDHGDSAAMLARILNRSGHSVKTAGTAGAAIEALGAAPFDLVLSDVGLPDATGYELMREIRERFGVKGIAMTGYGMEEDFAKSREAGFLAHVVKPINLNELVQTIQQVASATEAIRHATL